MNIQNNYKTFKTLLRSTNREGIEELIKFLDTSDCITAPASTKYHLCQDGGLVQHSLNVYTRLKHTIECDKFDISEESIIISALLHDLSKVNYYTIAYRKVKDDATGIWSTVPYITTRDQKDRLNYGTHAENSIFIATQYIKLTKDEQLAIRHHMGNWDITDNDSMRNITAQAYVTCHLALYLAQADQFATCIMETK